MKQGQLLKERDFCGEHGDYWVFYEKDEECPECRKIEGQLLKEHGLARVEANNAEFISKMRATAYILCRANGNVTADHLRVRARNLNVEPTHPNCWGAIFRSKDFKAIGYTQSTTPSCHGRTIRVWALA